MGYWSNEEDVKANWSIDRVFEPAISEEKQEKKIAGWHKAVRYAFDWAKEE